jgi:hypothetical protein
MIWQNKYLSLETKVRIYKSVVRPILTYSVETQADIPKTKQLLGTRELNTLRKTVGKTRLDHVTNQDIRQPCGIQPIREWILKWQEDWDNHTSRMTEDRIVRVVRDNIPKGKRCPGRPKKHWSDKFSLRNRLST